MTRIGLVVHGQPPELVGGTERLVADLAASLAARGDEVEIFSGSIEWRPEFEVVRDTSGPVPIVRVHRHDLFFERWDKLHDPFVERAYLAWLDAFRPQIVHVHHWARLTTTLVSCARRRGIPTVVTLHDLIASCPRYHRLKSDLSFCHDAPGPSVCRTCAPRWAFQGDREMDASVTRFVEEMAAEVAAADALVAPTAGHGQRVLQWLGLPDTEIHAVAPASTTALAPAGRPLGDAVASADEPLRVGTFGHLHPHKGVEVLLDALGHLADPTRVRVHVWGEAPTAEMDASLRQRAEGRRVTWHGAYRPEDLSGAAVDVVVLPTLCAESYSFTLDEAGALGVPIIATDLGALADRATGRVELFPRGDARALAGVLDRLATDPQLRAARAREPAPARLDADAHLSALDAVYASVLGGEGRGDESPGTHASAAEQVALAQRCHAFQLREEALSELLRSEGWESVVAALQARIEALEGPGED